MSQQPADKETVLVDVSGLNLEDLLANKESPLLESLERLATETELEVEAGFSDGIS